MLTTTGTLVNDGATLLYRASKHDCDAALSSPRAARTASTQGAALDPRGRSRHGPRDRKVVGGDALATATQEDRDAVRPPQTHSQARPATTTRTKRCARRVPPRSHRPEPPEAGQADPDAQPSSQPEGRPAKLSTTPQRRPIYFNLSSDFFNKIGQKRTFERCKHIGSTRFGRS